MMTKEQIKVFEGLIADPNFVGKNQLKHLLWMNTVKSKYSVGDCFQITNYGHQIYGNSVKDFKAKIIRVFSMKDSYEWHYELEMMCECEGKRTTSKEYKSESYLASCKKCKDNINKLDEAKSKYSDSVMV